MYSLSLPADTIEFDVPPRNGFLPPRYLVSRIDDADAIEWKSIPPVPLLTDIQGEEVPAHRFPVSQIPNLTPKLKKKRCARPSNSTGISRESPSSASPPGPMGIVGRR